MIIGIDLGTTNSAVAYIDDNGNPEVLANREGERTTPSVIYFEDGIPIVGSTAKTTSVADPENTVQFVKRQIGNISYKFPLSTGDIFTPEELSAIILKRLKEDAETILGKEITKAVITVPAYFDDAQRKATQDAGKIAGMDVLKVINEPTAAALAYGLAKKSEQQHIMVYDLGGGTFDVTIMSLKEKEVIVKATGGDRNLGGFDFDNKIIECVEQQFTEQYNIDLYDDMNAIQDLREKAEACKKVLSTRKKSVISVTSQGKSIKTEITRELFEQMISPLLNRTALIMNSVLMDANLTWGEIDKILLVGGSTRVLAVSDMIEKVSGMKPSLDVNPDEAVAIGAAIQGLYLCEKETAQHNHKTTVIDVNSHSLGMIVLNTITNTDENAVILPKNTPIPAKREQVFYTASSNQQQISITITEGEDKDPEYVRIIGKSSLQLPEPKPENYPIKFTVAYDENGVVHVYAHDGETNQSLGEVHIERRSNLTESAINEKTEKMAGISIE